MTEASGLFAGHVTHRRLRPRRHRLRYRLFMLLLDLDEIDALDRRLRLFSRNRRNLFAFHDRDHGAGGGEALRDQIEGHLRGAGLIADGGPIRLLTMPSLLGFVFNPLSVYFCHARDGALTAILYEVSNTFGERHSYLLPVDRGAAIPIRQASPKVFHVSPFLGLDMAYVFRVIPPADRLMIAITGSDGAGPLITAAFTAARRPLTDAALARAFLAYPLLTVKVVAGILWEAFRLWAKGVPVHRRPPPPARPVTHPPIAVREAACP